MKLKQQPQDFLVEEIPKEITNKGRYAVYELEKTNYNTEDAIWEIAKQLKIPRKTISYAGTKDKIAITKQTISINTHPKKINEFEHGQIKLKFIGMHNEPISLGDLKGNKFKITIRELTGEEKINADPIINYYHEQRFSKNNTEIGGLLIQKKYKEAIQHLQEDYKYGEKIKEHLEKNKNDYVGALKTIPKKILTLYAHAHQSKLWNETVKELKKQNALPDVVPIPGFMPYKTTPLAQEIINQKLKEENIQTKDFLNREINYLSLEGTTRKTVQELKNLKISEFEDDEINDGCRKLIIEFELEPGSYATNAIEQLIEK